MGAVRVGAACGSRCAARFLDGFTFGAALAFAIPVVVVGNGVDTEGGATVVVCELAFCIIGAGAPCGATVSGGTVCFSDGTMVGTGVVCNGAGMVGVVVCGTGGGPASNIPGTLKGADPCCGPSLCLLNAANASR